MEHFEAAAPQQNPSSGRILAEKAMRARLEWRGGVLKLDIPHPSPPGLTGWSIHPHTRRMKGYVYILATKKNGTLYTGVTSNPSRRWFEHQHELTPGFTARYGIKTLVWIERHDLVVSAIKREKAIKKWPRKWKLELIESVNPEWRDVSHWLLDI